MKALITGIAGQDGSYLAELLLAKGYSVHGVVRAGTNLERIAHLTTSVTLIGGDLFDQEFVSTLVKQHFDEIYNLACTVPNALTAWSDPVPTVQSTANIPLLFLTAIHKDAPQTRFFQAGSSEMYGQITQSPQNEETAPHPLVPYGWGKLLAHNAVEGYRQRFNIYAVSGILFNHDSPRRTGDFVSSKIARTLVRIAAGSAEFLELGNLDARRDWTFAGDIVEGMWLALQAEKATSYVFASGETHTVREYVNLAAQAAGLPLRWKGEGLEEQAFHNEKLIVKVNPSFFRPTEAFELRGDIAKARAELGWAPRTSFTQLVTMMVKGEQATK